MAGFKFMLVWVVLPLTQVALAFALMLRWRKRRGPARTRHRDEEDVVCRKCGYSLRGLKYPRCPQCGTLRGFDMPVDQLNLTDRERRLIEQKCRTRNVGEDEAAHPAE